MSNTEPTRSDFMGKNGFVWWHGVVEDIYDPLKLGRLRVRVLGWHTDDKAQIPTEDLPWAHVVMPINSTSVSGKGWSPTGVVQGAWVIGFFRDGFNGQEPVVFGTMGGINTASIPIPQISYRQKTDPNLQQKLDSAVGNYKDAIVNILDKTKNDVGVKPYQLPKNPTVNPVKGFSDPDGLYPLISRMGEADTNRLARNEQITATIVDKKRRGVTGCSTAIAGSWVEPKTPYNAQYPFNHVYESQAGHIVEYDDTPGSERMHWYHCSGTFNEIHPRGGEVHKVVGNAWDITLNDKMILVRGNAAFNTDKTLKIRMGKDLEIEVDGDAKMLVKGNMTTEVKGNYLKKIKGSCTIASESNMVFVAPRIDFNPEGAAAQSIQTSLEETRSFVNELMDRVSGISESSVFDLKDTIPNLTEAVNTNNLLNSGLIELASNALLPGSGIALSMLSATEGFDIRNLAIQGAANALLPGSGIALSLLSGTEGFDIRNLAIQGAANAILPGSGIIASSIFSDTDSQNQ